VANENDIPTLAAPQPRTNGIIGPTKYSAILKITDFATAGIELKWKKNQISFLH
jgi:hypothetical protein